MDCPSRATSRESNSHASNVNDFPPKNPVMLRGWFLVTIQLTMAIN
jgi:hypothetical protein